MKEGEHIKKLISILGEGRVLIDEPMSSHTSFKIGGPADVMVVPDSSFKIAETVRYFISSKIPYMVMGNGTNLLVSDKGIRGAVIKIYNNMNSYTVNGEFMEAEAGMLISSAAKIALQNSFSGLEFAEGIPGTIGGAVTMNAGAYTGEMAMIVEKTEFIDANGNIITVKGAEHAFGYRTSSIQKTKGIILKTSLKLNYGDGNKIKELMEDFNFRRKDKQPLEWPSAGSVFKRPKGHFTGKLIDDCGLRGYSIGGARISDKHSGFIINTGEASCKDVLELIGFIQGAVKDKFNIWLEPELRIIGDFGQ
ncbi:UDP-N-acetylmuramate dehydrogenase [Ruminiclostridium sufflavum DSM 19573]|uniref:UDP-N-acetylenolpyruvoylglucosamine reductase n=1 Tax=Ruminiclostridium sufflavum DSM 19573 TaxID=1121337 RepID=A0A318XLA4_9FIRM|nr:UDP-N-acetylmuramate dehydrogenase [Ruminiclostridium sufflavum]PYG85874.1 UDP-N-acetylmuramate dehydrogenase [Ruminiclostridium sufflavum DSM 19573]